MTIERMLSKAQSRAVLALVREREEIVRQANTQVAEINAALDEQAEVLRLHFELPEGKYDFFGDANGVTLRKVVEEKKAVTSPEHKTGGDDSVADIPDVPNAEQNAEPVPEEAEPVSEEAAPQDDDS